MGADVAERQTGFAHCFRLGTIIITMIITGSRAQSWHPRAGRWHGCQSRESGREGRGSWIPFSFYRVELTVSEQWKKFNLFQFKFKCILYIYNKEELIMNKVVYRGPSQGLKGRHYLYEEEICLSTPVLPAFA